MAAKGSGPILRPSAFSVLIALLTGLEGVNNLVSGGGADILLVCLAIILLKVVYIPRMLEKMCARMDNKVEKDFIFNIPLLVLICCALVAFAYFSLSGAGGILEAVPNARRPFRSVV
jgi:hydrogenase-4 component E